MKNLIPAWQQFHKPQQQWFSSLGFVSLALPTGQGFAEQYPQGEDYKYVDFSGLREKTLTLAQGEHNLKGGATDTSVRFEIGDFSEPYDFALTGLPKGLQVLTHGQDLKREDSLLNKESQYVTTNSFHQMAREFLGCGLILRAQDHVEKEIHLVLNLDNLKGESNQLANFHLLIECLPGTSMKVYLDIRGNNFQGLLNLTTSIWLGENSHLTFARQQKGSEDTFMVQTCVADIQKGAQLESMNLKLPGGWSRHDFAADLNGQGAGVQLRGLDLDSDRDFSDHHTQISHLKPHTESLQDYRGLLSGESRGVFNGKVIIAKGAIKSNSEQVNKNLMLSMRAEVDTKPELQIDNDDVKAAHGATVGQIDPDQRFYLLSRGYTPQQAMSALCRAFAFDLLEDRTESTQRFFQQSLDQALHVMKEE